MWRLATPVLIEQLLLLLVAFVDQWLAGRYLAQEHLAAIGLVWYAMWALPTMFGIVAAGATALTARYVGAGKPRRARWVVNQSMLAGAVLALLATFAFAWYREPFILAMQLEDEAARLASRYLLILLPLIPAMMVEQVGIACLRGAGDTVSGLMTMAAVNVVNVVVGAVLVTGWGGAPQLGWDGLAIGTAAGHGVGAVIVLTMLLRGRANLGLRLAEMAPQWTLLRRILRIGLPGGVDMMAIVGCHLWFLSIVNSLGVSAAAAHGLAVRIESLAYLPGTAFQVAAATMTGQYLGAGDTHRATQGALVCLLWGGGLMTLSALAMFCFPYSLTMFFLGEQTRSVAETAAPLLRIVACSIPSLAVLMILTGALRGAGDTRWPLAATFCGLVGVRIPLAYWLACTELPWSDVHTGCGWGVQGAWYAMLVDVIFRGLLIALRFAQGGWRRIRV